MFLRRQEKVDERVVGQEITGYQLAVNEGKKLIGEGRTKSQAAMAIYTALQSTDKETWASPEIPDTEIRCKDGVGGVGWVLEGCSLESSSSRQ